MGYCKVFDEKSAILKNAPNPEKRIGTTIDECIEQGHFVQYPAEHRTEVKKRMLEMYSPKYVDDAERKTEIVMDEISFCRDAGLSDEQIRDLLVRGHNMTPTYAQRCLNYKPGANTVMALYSGRYALCSPIPIPGLLLRWRRRAFLLSQKL